MPRPRDLGGTPGRPAPRVPAKQTVQQRREDRVLRESVQKAMAAPRPKVDTGDVLKSATPASRRKLAEAAPTRTRTVGKGSQRTKVTASTGDILAGLSGVPAKQPDRISAELRHFKDQSLIGAIGDTLTGKGPVVESLGRLLFPDPKPFAYKHDGRTDYVKASTSGIGGVRLNKVGQNLVHDAVGFPVGAVIGGYQLGAAGVEAAQGKTGRGKKLLGSLDKSALGELLVHGDTKAAAKAAAEHPLYSAMDVTAAGQILGRGAGAVARSGALGRKAKGAAGTKRAPLKTDAGVGSQVVERRYSPNVLVKGVQRAREKDLARHGADPNVAQGAARSRLMNSAVDEFAHQAEGTRRRGREEAGRAAAAIAPVRHGDAAGGRVARTVARADRARSSGADAAGLAGVRGRAERDVVLAAVEGRLHGPATFGPDLVRERGRLQSVYVAERKSMSPSARRANRAQVKSIDRVLADPKALGNAHEVFRAADAYNKHANVVEKDLIRQGALDPEQALTARVRSYGVSVMGLRPATKPHASDVLEARHAAAGAVSDSARSALAVAQRAERKAEASRHRLVGIQASRRGRERAAGKGASTLAERRRLDAATVALKSARVDRKAAERAFRDARAAHGASKPRRTVYGLVDGQGKHVPTQAILDHIAENGHRMPGFVGHRRDQQGAASFFVNWFGQGRKTVDSKTRTGEAARTGAYDSSYRALGEQLVRGQGVSDALGTFDHFVGQFGSKRRDGRAYTWDEATRTAEQMQEATGVAFSPVRAVPARYDAATRQGILDRQGTAAAPQHLESLTVGRLDDALKEPGQADRAARNVVLVPSQQLERFRSHQTSGSGPAAKLGQAATRAFRNTVLPFSTKWLFGNMSEALLRSAFNGVTPVDVIRGGRVMKELFKLDKDAWRAADTRMRGGLVYGSADKLTARRASQDFEGTMLHNPARAVELAGKLPVVRQVLGGLGVYKRAVFAANRGLERAFQQGVIGKVARQEAQELTGSWAKAIGMQQQVAAEVARGLLGTPKQVQFARAVDDVLGKYGRFSPSTRRVIQSFAPFLPWFMNAAKFVYHTLPVHHPVKTAVLTSAARAMQADINQQAKDVPPGDLQAAIRRQDGGLVDIARYTPFGAFTAGAEGLVAPVLPQIDSLVQIFHGNSFTGRPLKTHDGSPPQRLWLAMNALLESAVPGLQIARRIREKGGTPFDDSSVLSPRTKPGTARSGAADRILNPLRPVYVGGASPAQSSSGLSPALQRRVDRVTAAQSSGGVSAREQALQRRLERLTGSSGG